MTAPATAQQYQPEISPREIRTEQVRVVYRMLGQSAWLTLLLSLFAAAVLHDQGPRIWIWLAVQLSLKLSTQIELRWFYDPAKVSENLDRKVLWLCLTQAMHAAGWASLMWIAAEHGTPQQYTFIIMALGGVLSGGVTTYGALPLVHAAYIASFIFVNLITFVYLVFAIPDNPFFYLTPILSTFYCVGTYMNTRVSGEAYYRYILLGFTNRELVKSLAEQVAREEEARHEAEAANAAKSTFLASASHDLRQPIHAAGLFMALLEGTKLSNQQRDMLDNARSALGVSSEMLDALLDFSRAEAGVIVPQPRIFPINDLLTGIEAELGLQADEKQIAFRVHECDALVHCDPALVRLIMLNLVSNAIRYTARGGVLVGCRRRGGMLVLEVWDTGIGIPPEQHETIFADFAQIGNPERDRRKGLGLGLAIARRLARLICSDVTLSSRPGKGSVFRLKLPLASPTTESVQITAVAALAPPAQEPKGEPAWARILVLDDDPTILQGLEYLLTAESYAVDTAETIEGALAVAELRRPDLLICDFRLRQGRSGTEAARLLRERYGTKLPTLMITGDTHPDRIAMAEKEDLVILYKPADPIRILDTIRTLLRS